MIPKNIFHVNNGPMLTYIAYQGYPTAISNRVENGNWLALVLLTRWRTNSKIISVSNRPGSWYPMSQGAPVSPKCVIICNKTLFRISRHICVAPGVLHYGVLQCRPNEHSNCVSTYVTLALLLQLTHTGGK